MRIFNFTAPALAGAVLFIAYNSSFAQVTYSKSSDYQQGIQWGWSIILNPDSSFNVNASGTDMLDRQGLFFDIYNNDGNLVSRKIYFIDSIDFYAGLSSSMKRIDENQFSLFGTRIKYNPINYDVLAAKFNQSGDTLFFNRIETGSLDGAYNHTGLSDGGFAITGFTSPDSLTSTNLLLMKVDSNGNYLWHKSYGSEKSDAGYSIYEISGRRLVLAGIKRYTLTNFAPWIIVIDSIGGIIKEKEWASGALYCGGTSLSLSLDGQYFIEGCLDSVINSGEYSNPGFVAKLDTSFNILWKAVYNDVDKKSFYVIKQLADSTIVGVGFQGDTTSFFTKGWIAKIDNSGNKLWEHTYKYGNSTFNYFSDFQQTADKGFIITGSTIGPTSQDVWLVKLDSLGCLNPNECFAGDLTIEVTEGVDFRITPNPASSEMNVVYNLPQKNATAEWVIADLAGNVVFRKPVDTGCNAELVEVAQWQQGVYVCSLLMIGQVMRSKKFVVMH
jgi:hypothetical protein